MGGEIGGGEMGVGTGRWLNKPFPCLRVQLYSRVVAIVQADPRNLSGQK